MLLLFRGVPRKTTEDWKNIYADLFEKNGSCIKGYEINVF